MLRRLLVLVASAALIAVVVVPVAGANPANAKNAQQVQLVCAGQPVTVVVNGNGEFTPGHVVGSKAMFIPTAFNVTFTFTPTGGSPMSETDTTSKAAPLKNTTTCTIPLQTVFSGPEGTATIQGTVTGFFTPR
jgi:opacity protein-like surface antigen